MDSFASVIDAFGGTTEFGEAIGILDSHARAMKSRNSIPSARWRRVVLAAAERGIEGVTLEKLAELAAARPAEARA